MGALSDWLSGQRAELLWIEFTDYALAVFGGGDELWQNAASIAALLGQAQGLINSDVVTLDAGRIMLGGVTPGDDPFGTLSDALQDPGRLAVLGEAVDACTHNIGADLVLALPTPSTALKVCGADDEAANDFGNLDDTGAAYTDVIRSLADKRLGGLAFRLPSAIGDDEIDALGPVVAAAKHYDWPVVIIFEASDGDEPPQGIADAVLLPNQSEMTGEGTAAGLVADFWIEPHTEPPASKARYGRIPADAVPEVVLAQLTKLR